MEVPIGFGSMNDRGGSTGIAEMIRLFISFLVDLLDEVDPIS